MELNPWRFLETRYVSHYSHHFPQDLNLVRWSSFVWSRRSKSGEVSNEALRPRLACSNIIATYCKHLIQAFLCRNTQIWLYLVLSFCLLIIKLNFRQHLRQKDLVRHLPLLEL